MCRDRFRIKKREIWVQEVWVVADTEEEALSKAVDGDYEIHDDAEFECNAPMITWEIE